MFNLPSPRPYHLQHPPLAQATVQVRFPLIARLQTLAGLEGFQARVADLLPYLGQVQQHQVAFLVAPTGPVSPPATDFSTAWSFTDDSDWILSLEPGAATLSVGSGYVDVNDMEQRLNQVLRGLLEEVQVARCDRIGVRYVDLVDIDLPADNTESWTAWFRPELTGWVSSGIVADNADVNFHLTQSQLAARPSGDLADAPADIQANVRYGIVPPGTGIQMKPLAPPHQVQHRSFLLDLDLFVEGPQPFDPDRIGRQFRGLHREIDAFFRWSVTDRGAGHFGLVEQ